MIFLGKKYHTEKELFGDRTILYDEHGKKIGYSEKALLGDHINIYDDKGRKIGRQEKSFFGDHVNVYDAKGDKVGRQEKSFFGDHINVYDAKGNKVGESHSSFRGSGTDYYSFESTASPFSAPTTDLNHLYAKTVSTSPAGAVSPNTVLSSQSYSNVSNEALAKIAAASHELTVEEAAEYAKLCVSLLEKADVKTDGTVYSKEEYKKKVRCGFLHLKSYETTETKYVPGEAYWVLRRQNENEERVGFTREEKYILALTKSGKFYDGEIRENYYHGGGYALTRNNWKECTSDQLSELIPLLDLLLKRHGINMSSGAYRMRLHPQERMQTSSSRTGEKSGAAPKSSSNPEHAYVLTVSKSGDQADLVKAIRTLYGCGLNEGKQWAASSQNIIMKTNDKNKVMEAVHIFEGMYGIQVMINGRSKPKQLKKDR